MHYIESKLRAIGAVFSRPLSANCMHITDDTREVAPGDVFVLRQGSAPLEADKAQQLVKSAVEYGASAILCDPAWEFDYLIPYIYLTEPHKKLVELSEAFYGNPSNKLRIIAVTGTNGKTTTSYIIESILKQLGLRVGVIGTISHRYPGYSECSVNTTPGVLKLRRLLHSMINEVDCVIMEVSSHGLELGRVEGIYFDTAIWTNFGQDHLDLHKTLQAYAETKARLFSEHLPRSLEVGKRPCAVYNADDPEVDHYIHDVCNSADWGGRLLSFGTAEHDNSPDLRLEVCVWSEKAWRGIVRTENKDYSFSLPLVGRHNVLNALAASGALLSIGFKPTEVFSSWAKIEQVPGRMQALRKDDAPLVLIDFAHTPQALESALESARSAAKGAGRLWVVFGAGGDRDPSKRPQMGRVAAQLADNVVVTSDNPRTEDPLHIMAEIESGFEPGSRASTHSIVDRKEAICYALSHAKSEDCVLIAGKGHEKCQILGEASIAFEDMAVVQEFWGISNNSDT